jgi:FG-GAP-like repeat
MVMAMALSGLGLGAAELRPLPVRPAPTMSALDEVIAKVDPAKDGAFPSEVFADQTSAQLKALTHALEKVGEPDVAAIRALAAPDATLTALRPPSLREVHRDGALVVFRGAAATERLAPTGPDALVAALGTWTAAYPAGSVFHAKFKTVGVTLATGSAPGQIVALVQCWGESADHRGTIQQTSQWTISWDTIGGPQPLIRSISIADYEEIQPLAVPAPTQTPEPAPEPVSERLFVDAAPQVLGGTPQWRNVLTHSLDFFFARVDAAFQIPQGYHGVVVRDIDGDGREDLFLCQPAGLANQLFLRQPDGTLKDAGPASGLDLLDNTRAALFVDLDQDGDPDAVLTAGYAVIVLENDGHAHFTKRAQFDLASWPMSLAAADPDLDGDLDLYLCGYTTAESVDSSDLLGSPDPYHDANNGARNFLVLNQGKFQFTDATDRTGLSVNNRRFSLAATWEDYDNDGDVDLYVANDFGRKNLYRNDLITPAGRQKELKFTDIAPTAGVEDLGAGMSCAWADADRDGWMDLYVANMFSSAGRRVASQPQFQAGETAENRSGFLRQARGNSLFHNRGDGTFTDEGDSSGTELGRWAWASLWTDFNNDAWPDLYVANGFFTRPDPGDL